MNLKLFCFLYTVLFLVTSELSAAGKKNRTKGRKRTSNLCRQSNQKTSKPKLEFVAFFHFKKRTSGVACFKIQTCTDPAVCFVAKTPSLKSANLSNYSLRLWHKLIATIQGKQKVEPVNGGSQPGFGSGLRGDKFIRSLSDVGSHPTVSRMCRNAIVYRFGASDNNSTRNNATSSPISTTPRAQTQPPQQLRSGSSNVGNIRTTNSRRTSKKRNRKNRRCRKTSMRNKRRRNGTDDSLCNVPCFRICVAQKKANDNFSDCRKFRVSCKFDCSSKDSLIRENRCLFTKLFKPMISRKFSSKRQKRHNSRQDLRKLFNAFRYKKT